MADHASLNNVLMILLRYLKGHQFTLQQLMSITGKSDRTISNYHTTLANYGFIITRDSHTRLYSLKDRDETSVHRLISRLGLYQDTFFLMILKFKI